MRRLFPFYSWSRFNLPLHLEMFVQNPAKYAQLERARHMVTKLAGGQLPDEIDPEYIREGYAIGISKTPGKRTYIVLKSWLPQADVGDILSVEGYKDLFLRLVHPIKTVPEAVWGRDTFKKRDLPAYPGERKELLGIKMHPKLAHLASPIRLIQDTNKILFGKQDTFLMRFAYTLFGRAYDVNVPEAKKYLRYYTNEAIGELSRGIEKAKKNKDYKMAKKLVYNYTFTPGAANSGTLEIHGNYPLKTFQLITNITDGIIIFNFADPANGGTTSYNATTNTTTLTLEHDTSAMSADDQIQIFVDIQDLELFVERNKATVK